jgi:hypothetical protein
LTLVVAPGYGRWMSSPARSRRLLAITTALALALAVPAAAADDDPKVVADGLDNPRGLAFGPGGHLYVAEAGRGGDGPCVEFEGSQTCFGTSAAVTRVDLGDREQKRITTGLPSLAGPEGTDALGASDISFPREGRKSYDDRGFLTVGLGGSPDYRAQFGEAGAAFGVLHRLWPDGRVRALADITAFEGAENPDQNQPETEVDSNPNSVAAINGREAYVADAGGNSIVKADRLGNVELVGVLPFGEAPAPPIPDFPVPPGTPIPFQPVPTSLAIGEGGKVFVGQLTGFPFPKGGAGVWVIEPGEDPKPFATGFTTITDIALDRDGNLYVVQITSEGFLADPSPGALIRVTPDGDREELAAGKLIGPYGIAIRGDHAYVTQHAPEAGIGEVVRIALDEDGTDDD